MSINSDILQPASAVKPISLAEKIVLAELCRQLVLDSYSPAAVLIDTNNACIFSMGPTDLYLRIAPSYPTSDLFAMTPPGLKIKLRAALNKAQGSPERVVVDAGANREHPAPFKIDIQPIKHEGTDYYLVCFIDCQKSVATKPIAGARSDAVVELERELEATRSDLHDALHELDTSGQEQMVASAQALSANQEYQSSNQDLRSSQEGLQSLNDELNALNNQLQAALDLQRATAKDLQNVLYSTDLATIFLDAKLNIRFFTPATKALFNVIPGDIGRPLSDLNALATDVALLTDAAAVLKSSVPIEREIEARSGEWFIRRILPYRAENGDIEGVVITFANITDRRHAAEALKAAESTAQSANIAKSRFLAAASHDLRQPLQSLKLVQGMLAKSVKDEPGKALLARLDDTVGAMSGMLNTLLDINQIEAGTVQAHKVGFPIDDILRRLRGEFTYVAQAQGLELDIVPSSLIAFSDPQLLEQMVRNLLANALKYTRTGKVLVGCLRRSDTIVIQVIDTGIGIPQRELNAIFEEYHQLHNEARERSQGLGLGLSIVKQLGNLLDHHVSVQSAPDRGSSFSITVPRVAEASLSASAAKTKPSGGKRLAKILVVEDDPEIRDLMQLLLEDEGHQVSTALDGTMALDIITRLGFRPELIMADFNLPGGMDGIEVIADLRGRLGSEVPAIILSGDISTDALMSIGLQDCLHFSKPVKAVELLAAIARLLKQEAAPSSAAILPPSDKGPAASIVYIVDDELAVRTLLRDALEAEGLSVIDFESAEAFLLAYAPTSDECLLVDAYLPGLSGVELIRKLRTLGHGLPTIMVTGSSDVTMAVDVMKAGAMDFIEKPVGTNDLLAAVNRALDVSKDTTRASNVHDEALGHLAGLTKRQRQIMDMVLAGHPSKNIAADLNLSQRTVENHRAEIMRRTGTKSLPGLARLVFAATV